MHTLLTAILPAAGLLGCAGYLGYRAGTVQTARRISHTMQTDRAAGIAIIEDLAERWGVKIEHQETPGGV